jgi:hypothetical protein
MGYKSVRNFCHPQGKPRMYWLVERYSGKGWWVCKLMMPSGTVVGYGRARSITAAYNAFVRDKRFRERYPNHWRNSKGY